MTQEITVRIATHDDLPSLAVLRWRLKMGDETPAEGGAFSRFADEFIRAERVDRAHGEIAHWIANLANKPVAAMSVIVIRKVTSPGSGERRWGYLTNCYVAPEQRNAGVGGRLMDAIQSWAREQAFEFIIVWPSDRAFTFYERSGFRRPEDLLVWTPEQAE
jgi:GNAT superfamily N-acetyltransferase